jgi:hypothetical protein
MRRKEEARERKNRILQSKRDTSWTKTVTELNVYSPFFPCPSSPYFPHLLSQHGTKYGRSINPPNNKRENNVNLANNNGTLKRG